METIFPVIIGLQGLPGRARRDGNLLADILKPPWAEKKKKNPGNFKVMPCKYFLLNSFHTPHSHPYPPICRRRRFFSEPRQFLSSPRDTFIPPAGRGKGEGDGWGIKFTERWI